MSNNKTTTSSGGGIGIGFCGLLTIAFIVLKLCHVIAWSWVWVLCPIWISWAIVLLIVIICLICCGISEIKEKHCNKMGGTK